MTASTWHTEYSLYTDEELLSIVFIHTDCTPLENELANRLAYTIDKLEEK